MQTNYKRAANMIYYTHRGRSFIRKFLPPIEYGAAHALLLAAGLSLSPAGATWALARLLLPCSCSSWMRRCDKRALLRSQLDGAPI